MVTLLLGGQDWIVAEDFETEVPEFVHREDAYAVEGLAARALVDGP